MSTPAPEPAPEPWVFLLGRPPMDEYLSFLVQAKPGENVDMPAAAERWRVAATTVDGLAETERGIADAPTIASLPPALLAQAEEYMQDPVVAATYAFTPATVGIVELKDIVVFQRQINLRYVSELREHIGDWKVEDDRLLNFCLAIDQKAPSIDALQASSNSFVFKSRSTDARFMGHALLDASQITGYAPMGRARYALVLYVGYSANALSVVSANGRLILNNGSHRAYALMTSGITHVPAVIQHATREDDLAVVPIVKQNIQLYLTSPRPPMLKDYFTESLHEVINAPPRFRQIRLQYGAEAMDVPG